MSHLAAHLQSHRVSPCDLASREGGGAELPSGAPGVLCCRPGSTQQFPVKRRLTPTTSGFLGVGGGADPIEPAPHERDGRRDPPIPLAAGGGGGALLWEPPIRDAPTPPRADVPFAKTPPAGGASGGEGLRVSVPCHRPPNGAVTSEWRNYIVRLSGHMCVTYTLNGGHIYTDKSVPTVCGYRRHTLRNIHIRHSHICQMKRGSGYDTRNQALFMALRARVIHHI